MGIWTARGRDGESVLSMKEVGRKGPQDLHGQEQNFLPSGFAGGELVDTVFNGVCDVIPSFVVLYHLQLITLLFGALCKWILQGTHGKVINSASQWSG